MKLKYCVLLALLLSGMSACSDDDDGAVNDPCQNACSKLNACGTGVACSGVTLPTNTCVSNCKKSRAESAANCIIQVPSCREIEKLQNCASQIPCR
jgi:hypothetical protein